MLKIKKMIIENLPADIKNCLKLVYNNFKWKGSNRIFCISMQRSGTTSVGNFFSSFGYPVATNSIAWKNKWSKYWYNGDYDSIFSSKEFNSYSLKNLLKSDGKIFVEIGKGQENLVSKIGLQNGLLSVGYKKDLSNINRVIVFNIK